MIRSRSRAAPPLALIRDAADVACKAVATVSSRLRPIGDRLQARHQRFVLELIGKRIDQHEFTYAALSQPRSHMRAMSFQAKHHDTRDARDFCGPRKWGCRLILRIRGKVALLVTLDQCGIWAGRCAVKLGRAPDHQAIAASPGRENSAPFPKSQPDCADHPKEGLPARQEFGRRPLQTDSEGVRTEQGVTVAQWHNVNPRGNLVE